MQEEGLSLLAQNNRLHEYAERKGLEIIKSFEIVESSTRGERKQFMEMINFCKKQREGDIVILTLADFTHRLWTTEENYNCLAQEAFIFRRNL